METKYLEDRLKANGVKNLKEFGYAHANMDNIMTDDVYKEFFKSMLNDNKGYDANIDKAIDKLITQIS